MQDIEEPLQDIEKKDENTYGLKYFNNLNLSKRPKILRWIAIKVVFSVAEIAQASSEHG